jgi:Zn finger protein HypA/HybF involved in hydrogenase expression
MIKLLKSLFKGSGKKKKSGSSTVNETLETKKCLRCLRRVNIDLFHCPHCRSDNFQF